MAEQDSTTPVSGQPEPSRGKSAKRKATNKRSTAPVPVPSPGESSEHREGNSVEAVQGQAPRGEQDPQRLVVIQKRAYWLWEAGGFQHGHALDHWLEAERQVTGSDRKTP